MKFQVLEDVPYGKPLVSIAETDTLLEARGALLGHCLENAAYGSKFEWGGITRLPDGRWVECYSLTGKDTRKHYCVTLPEDFEPGPAS